jgi:DNA-3-methyladenine glycosylase II
MDNTLIVKAKRHLRRNDPIMAQLIKSHAPFSFEKNNSKKKPSHYHSLVRTIINQQLSVKAASTILGRLLLKQGGNAFSAKKLQTLSDDQIRECGLSKNKTRYIRAITQAVNDKKLNFRKFVNQDDETVTTSLVAYPGIGQWSAEMFLIFSLDRLDVLPLGDLIIRKSMQRHYQLDENCDYDEYRNIARAWQPYRTIASRYLWAASG